MCSISRSVDSAGIISRRISTNAVQRVDVYTLRRESNSSPLILKSRSSHLLTHSCSYAIHSHKRLTQQKKQREREKKELDALGRRQYANVRVVQRNVVYVVGLNARFAKEEVRSYTNCSAITRRLTDDYVSSFSPLLGPMSTSVSTARLPRWFWSTRRQAQEAGQNSGCT